MEVRKMHEEDCKTIYTLNTWTDEKKAEARKYLEEGYWVEFASNCLGSTMADMVERAGLRWAKEEYGDTLQIAEREGYGFTYCRIR